MYDKHVSDAPRRRDLIAAVGGAAITGISGCVSSGGSVDENTSDRNSSNETVGTPEPPAAELGPELFEELSVIKAVGGRLSADTERHVTGTQCGALETSAGGTWLHVPLAEPVDFSRARPACHVAADGPAASEFLYLDLQDVDGNRFRTRTVIRSRTELVQVDFGTVNPRVDNATVDLERIERLSFRAGPRDDSGTETIYLDYPRRVPVPETATVVFQFDDGNESDLSEGFRSLSRYDYPAITYVNTDTIGSEGKLDESQLGELQRGNWLIGSHTTEHTDLTTLSDPEAIERRMRGAKQWLVDRGFADGARHLAYPYNAVDERVLSIASDVYATGRAWDWQPGPLPSNLHLIPADGDPSPSDFSRLLDRAVRYGGVLCVTHHNLSTDSEISNFDAIVDEVRRRDTLGDVDVVRLDELESMAADAGVSPA